MLGYLAYFKKVVRQNGVIVKHIPKENLKNVDTENKNGTLKTGGGLLNLDLNFRFPEKCYLAS